MTIWEWLALSGLVLSFAVLLIQGARRSPDVANARALKAELHEITRVLRQAEAAGEHPPNGIWQSAEYLKRVDPTFTRLHETGEDPFGTAYGDIPVGARPVVPRVSLEQIVVPLDASFWSPFPLEGAIPRSLSDLPRTSAENDFLAGISQYFRQLWPNSFPKS